MAAGSGCTNAGCKIPGIKPDTLYVKSQLIICIVIIKYWIIKIYKMNKTFSILFLITLAACSQEPLNISGIYPHLAQYNDEGECGTGAVVPWANRL